MIGFVCSPRSKEANRTQLEDIVIEKKLPEPITQDSFWTTAPQRGFTAFVTKLFDRRRQTTTDEQFNGVKRRASDLSADVPSVGSTAQSAVVVRSED